MAGEKQDGRIGWIDITTDDAGACFYVIEDPSGATAALFQPPPA